MSILNHIQIRKIDIDELNELQMIGRQTFHETFAEINTPEDMEKYLEESFHTDKLTNEIQNPNSEFYFATFENQVVGYLKLNFGQTQTEFQYSNSMEIERIYVLKEFHRKRVGQILLDKALLIAHQSKSEFVWLGVWENNERAINFYKKNGFVEFDKHVFKLGEDEQTDIIMKLKFGQ